MRPRAGKFPPCPLARELRWRRPGFSSRWCAGLGAAVCLTAWAAWADTNDTLSEELPPLRPPRPEIPPGFWEQHEAWVLAAAIVLLIIVGAGVWFLTRPRPPVVVSPATRARAALEALRNQPETGLVLSKISQIIRRYFGATCQMPQEEHTTTEFARILVAQKAVDPILAGAVNEFLRECDLRKFAPVGPLPPLGAVAGATHLIEEAEAKRSALLPETSNP